MKRWKVAIMGCGMIAQDIYIPQLRDIPKAELAAVCDINPERARECAEKFQVPNWYSDYDELLANCEFDILMDTASIPAHHEINMKALKAGKHLYSQKPAGLTVEQVTEQIEAAKEAKVKFSASPIHMIRPDIKKVREIVANGTIGKVTMIRVHASHGGPEYFQYRDADPSWFFKPGAGALFDMGVHGITMATAIMDRPAKEVGCMAAVSEPERTVRSGAYDGKKIKSDMIPDNYLITLDWGDGCIGIIDTGFCQKASTVNMLEVYGTLGTVTILGELKIGEGDGVRLYLDDPEKKVRGWMDPLPQMYPDKEFHQADCIADLIEAIENDTATGLPPEHARHVIDILCTIPKAIEEKKILPLHTEF